MERNSELKAAKWVGVVAFVVSALAGAVQALSEAGLAEHWPFFATLAGFFLPAAAVVGKYIQSRPAKTEALAKKALAKAVAAGKLKLAKQGQPEPEQG